MSNLNLSESINEEAKWYVIHTYSGYEKNVETNIRKIVENRKMEHLIQDLKIPLEKSDETDETDKTDKTDETDKTDKTEETDGAEKTEKTEKPAVKTKKERYDKKLLPSYVLVKMVMCDESWHVVRNTRGVTAFVGPGSKPIALTEEEIQRLEIEVVVPLVDFEVGDSVKITEGALKGSVGIVEEISADKKKVKLTISMFGRQTVIEMETSAVMIIK